LPQLQAALQAERTDRGLRVTLPSDALFGSARDKLEEAAAGAALLSMLSEMIAATPWRQVVVIGHPDGSNDKESEKLSNRRAHAVAVWLQAHAPKQSPDFVANNHSRAVKRNRNRQQGQIEILLRRN